MAFKNPALPPSRVTVGAYLADRLATAGCGTVFSVPGDFTLTLLDELLDDPRLRLVGTCNELNAGYAADGFSRATGGLACVVVTYMVGSLSMLSAAAGALAEDVPVLVVCGGPNSTDCALRRVVHHSVGQVDLFHSSRCFSPVVEATFIVRGLENAAEMIDSAVTRCLSTRRPVYLEIACDLHSKLIAEPAPVRLSFAHEFDPVSLEACVVDVIARLQDSTKPVVVAGRGMRASDQTLHSFATMAEIAGCAVACQPDAKGLFDESHPLFIGTYWGLCSTPLAAETVESADLLLLAGCVLTDYNTAGWTANIHLNRCIIAGAKGVSVCGKQYSNVRLGDFLDGLAKRVMRRDKSAVNYRRFVIDQVPSPVAVSSSATESPPTAPLTHRALREALQHHISTSSEIMVDVGDSWFLGQELRLPSGARYHSQMMYGATGWSLGASLGLVLGSDARREVLVLIGDGALQMSFQELSTLIRHDLAVTVVCINNSGYVTDRCILDGAFNDVNDWDYADLVEALSGDSGSKGAGFKAATACELNDALAYAKTHSGGPVLIECLLDKFDCSLKLLEWGQRVSKANMRPAEL